MMLFDVFGNSLYKFENSLNYIFTFMLKPAAQYDSHECQVMIPFFPL